MVYDKWRNLSAKISLHSNIQIKLPRLHEETLKSTQPNELFGLLKRDNCQIV